MKFIKNFLCVVIFLSNTVFSVSAQDKLKLVEYNLTQFHPFQTYEKPDIIRKLTPESFQKNPDFGICFNDSLNWHELIQRRTATTRTYISANGDSIYDYAADEINYFKDGWWRAIDPRLSPVQNGWSAIHQKNPTHLLSNGITEISLGGEQKLKFNINSTINGTSISMNDYTVGDNGMYIHSAIPGIDKKIVFRKNEIETDYFIQNATALAGINDLIISEEINLPAGFTIKKDELKGEGIGNNWMGELIVYDTEKKEQARFRTPVFYDSNTDSMHCKNSFLVGTYHLSDEANGKYFLEIIVPAYWLKDPSRVFPVTIDPIVTGPTVTWAGGTIGSCWLPAATSSTINVTVPAGLAITNFYVTASYYAAPGTWLAYGYMYFTTNCGRDPQNPNFYWTLGPPAGNASGGPAYLSNQDMKQTLSCCFAPSCAVQTIPLVMHLTRNQGGSGCNATYIYYNPATIYPFCAHVVGKTLESSNALWTVNPATVCGNNCNLTITATANSGVAPYTISHPWAASSVAFGSYNPAGNPCTSAGTTNINISIPGCPTTCGGVTVLSVPPPIITDACGNVVTGLSAKNVTINPVPVATTTPATQTVCSNTPISIALTSCVAGTTYSWNGSNGTSGNGNISATLSNSVCPLATITYTITPIAGVCVGATTTAQVSVVPIPSSSFTVNPSSVCSGQAATITYSGGACAGATFTWDFGSGNILSGTGLGPYQVSWSTVGSQTVTLQVTQGTCVSTITSVNVNVTLGASVVINPSPVAICSGQNILLTASGATNYTWSPALGLSGTNTAAVTASPITTTTYSVIGTSANGCSNTNTVVVTVNPFPTVLINPAVASVCSGQNVALNAVGAVSYVWSPAASLNNSTGTTVTSSPIVSTTYTIVGTSGVGCSDQATVVVSVLPFPTINIIPVNSSICSGASVNLIANGANTYVWSPSTGLNNSTNSTVTASPIASITYTVSGIGANGCSATASTVITVNSIPVINISPVSPSICAGGNVQLTASGASTYSWNPPTALSSNSIPNPVATPVVTSTYTVTGTSAQNCSSTAQVVVTVNPIPNVSFSGLNAANCITSAANNLTGNPAGGVFSGTGITGNNFDPSLAGTGGPYTITYSYTDANGCSNTSTQQTSVSAGATITASAVNNSICAGSNTVITAAGGLTYTWSPATGLNNSTNSSVTAQPASNITYTVIGIDNTGCSGTASVAIAVNALPNVTATGTSICAGQTGNISAAGASFYSWLPNTALSSSNVSNPTTSPATTTTYTVSGTDVNGCVNTATAVVTVFPAPVVTVNPSATSFCEGATISITANGATTYSWSPPTALNTVNGATVISTPVTSIVYTVTGTDANSCVAAATSTLTFDPTPVASFTVVPSTGCEPLKVSLQNTSANGVTSIWHFGDGTNGFGNSTQHYYAAGTYDVIMITANATGCSDSATQFSAVTALVSPVAIFYMDPPAPGHLIYSDNLFNFYNLSTGATHARWNFGDHTSDTSYNSIHSFSEMGEYNVVLTAIAENGCTDTAQGPLIFIDGEPKPWIPSAFTPNNDGANDLLKIYGIGISTLDFRVYDRFGEMVFQTKDYTHGWDGTFRGANVNTNVFVYMAEVEMLSGEKYILKGDVTLIR
ncbi:hypothetical protein LBMAG27_17110 [Bacteroidota bacterium]|nr:hypothetical protein LBMAG27_17110 [Bacteroidota bacterium]